MAISPFSALQTLILPLVHVLRRSVLIFLPYSTTSSLSSCISIICCLLFSFSFLISDIAARMIPVLRTRRKRRAGLPSLS